jgi:hypothetical protein
MGPSSKNQCSVINDQLSVSNKQVVLTVTWKLNAGEYYVQINSQLIKNQGQKIHLPINPDSQPACFFNDQWYTIWKSEI